MNGAGSSSQSIVTSAQLPLYESQNLQMLADMKERMKEKQAPSDRVRELVTLNCENVVHEQRR